MRKYSVLCHFFNRTGRKLFDEEEDADYETLKQEFLDDLEEFECDELGEDPDDKAYIKHLKEIGDMIDTFVYYFTLGVR